LNLKQENILLFLDLERLPTWLTSIGRPGKWTAQDRQGIDIVAQTIRGPVFIQVKSSEAGAREFKFKHRNDHVKIRIVVLDIRLCDKRIYQLVMHEIQEGFKEL
jgi:hypothetical protein